MTDIIQWDNTQPQMMKGAFQRFGGILNGSCWRMGCL